MTSSAGSHGIARTIRKRTEEQRQLDLVRIEKYQDLELQIRQQTSLQNFADPALLGLTTKLLRLNPEYYTIWNVRRRCLISGSLSKPSAGSWPSRGSPNTLASDTTKQPSDDYLPSSLGATPRGPKSPKATMSGQNGSIPDEKNASISEPSHLAVLKAGVQVQGQNSDTDAAVLQSELQFTLPLLLEFPKCYWIWNHRSYILQLAVLHLPLSAAREIWTTELGLVSKMLNKDRRNFHAWSYRRKVVAKLESEELQGQSMAESEFAYTRKMIDQDLSNFSAWHARSQLALRILDERAADDDARKTFLWKELELAREGLNVGPDDQSLWYYHHFLMSQLLDHDVKLAMAPNLMDEERLDLAKKEIEEIKDLLEDYHDVKWIYEALLEYSTAFGTWKRSKDLAVGDLITGDESKAWLTKLRQLDPLRSGRWNDVEQNLDQSC